MSIPEQIIEYLDIVASEEERADTECAGEMKCWIAWLREAACLLAPFEQPKVARLHRKAVLLERNGFPERAEECRGHVRVLVELTDAQEKLKRVGALPGKWRGREEVAHGGGYSCGDLTTCTNELDAALVDAIRATETAAEEADYAE